MKRRIKTYTLRGVEFFAKRAPVYCYYRGCERNRGMTYRDGVHLFNANGFRVLGGAIASGDEPMFRNHKELAEFIANSTFSEATVAKWAAATEHLAF
jgi:hypothetical protein